MVGYTHPEGALMNSQVRFTHVGPQFSVRDVSKAEAFYLDVLGFGLDYVDGDPATYAVVFRDDVYLHLSVPQDPEFPPGVGRAFMVVNGVDAVWEKARSVAPESIREPLEDRDYGQDIRFRVFSLTDLEGNTLRIAEPINDEEQ
jgi:catechol 2,3-dioxygenase-like lactoylglutathione lyase family enzyme